MNIWFYVGIVPVTVFISDYFYVRRKMHKMRGVIQTLQIAELQNSVINDLFMSHQSANKIYEVITIALTTLQSKEKIDQENQLSCLNTFADVLYKNISSDCLQEQIVKVCRTPYIMSISDYMWLHELVYQSKVRESYINFAFDALNQFVTSLVHRTRLS